MIIKVETKKQLKDFIYFPKTLYQDEPNYVYPFFRVLTKELTRLVLKEKTYHALLFVYNREILGRILYTFERKSENESICYFSFFDFYEDLSVAKALVDRMAEHMKAEGVSRMEGPYAPYDPDTRRGVLTNRFDALPSVFLTYNYPYYVDIYEKLGFLKVTDTLSISLPLTDAVYTKAERMGKLMKKANVTVTHLDRKHLAEDISAVASIMKEATTEMNYESAPDEEKIASVFREMSLFIEDEYVILAREKDTGRAVGFLVILPELNQVFCRLKGSLDLIKYFLYKKKINKVRGWLQYVVPEYQRTTLLAALLAYAGKSMQKRGITAFEGGTVVEANERSFGVYRHFGGEIDKRYRIYYREEK